MLAGLARDGGLYLRNWPTLSADAIAGLAGLSYEEVALRVLAPFVGRRPFPRPELRRLIRRAYAGFGHAARVPLVQIEAERLAARALPRADARLQGRGDAADRPALPRRA